jgi:hypothetical protein
MGPADIDRVMAACDAMEGSEHSKVFANEDFGYWKATAERLLRLHSRITPAAIAALRTASGDREIREAALEQFSDGLVADFAAMRPRLEGFLGDWGSEETSDEEDGDESPKLGGAAGEALQETAGWRHLAAG